jgi:NADH:ubiquinone oxidoreductase subunit E
MRKRGAFAAGAVVALCVAVLVVDYAVARRRAPRDEKLIAALQVQVKSEASLAPKLAAEQKRVTDARRARKRRDDAVANVLIAAASVFLWLVGKAPRPVQPAMPVRSISGTTAIAAKASRTGQEPCPTVEELVEQFGRSKEAAIPILQAIQRHYRYLPDDVLRRVCELTEITPAQIAGTSSFYGQFRRSPVGEHVIRVCHGTACHVAGARHVTDELCRYLRIPEGADTDPDRQFTIEEVACLGCCSLAPVLMVDGHTAGRLTPATACEALKEPV